MTTSNSNDSRANTAGRALLRRVTLGLGGLVLATAGILSGAAPAEAATGCWGDWCSGKDPAETGCAADAETLSATDVTNGRLELRWSATCKTEWARYTQYDNGSFTQIGESPISISAVQDTGYRQHKNSPDADAGGVFDAGTYWTPMIYSPNHKVRAQLFMPCGGMTVFSALMDCAINNGVDVPATDWK